MARKKVVILGAGISGLALAWELQKKSSQYDVTLVEKSSRVGGWLHSIHKKGFLFELGPRSFRGAETRQLIDELGLTPQIVQASEHAKSRYLLHKNRLERAPSGLFSAAKWGIIPPLLRDWIRSRTPCRDQSIGQFFSDRLGESLTNRLVEPLVTGIFAGDIHQLSMAASFPNLWREYCERGSLIKAMIYGAKPSPIFSLINGVEVLPRALAAKIDGEIALSSKVLKLENTGDKFQVTLSDRTLEADMCISTLSPHALAPLVNGETATLLSQIPATTVVVVNLGYYGSVLPLRGFGYLIAPSERGDILGVVFDSDVFPQQNRQSDITRLTVLLGGVHRPDIAELSEEKILQMTLKSLELHLGIKQAPDVTHCSYAVDAIPQYPVGHLDLLKKLEVKLSPLVLHGSGFYGVSVNECIARRGMLN